jgi:hypothetical protein
MARDGRRNAYPVWPIKEPVGAWLQDHLLVDAAPGRDRKPDCAAALNWSF